VLFCQSSMDPSHEYMDSSSARRSTAGVSLQV
jgi:hypothetical protein